MVGLLLYPRAADLTTKSDGLFLFLLGLLSSGVLCLSFTTSPFAATETARRGQSMPGHRKLGLRARVPRAAVSCFATRPVLEHPSNEISSCSAARTRALTQTCNKSSYVGRKANTLSVGVGSSLVVRGASVRGGAQGVIVWPQLAHERLVSHFTP